MATTDLGKLLVSIGVNLDELSKGLGDAEKKVQGFSSRTNAILKTSGVALTAVGAAVTAFAGVAVRAADEQERAVALLGQAMKNTGTFTEQALEAQVAFAKGLQQTTVFADEQIERVQTLLVNFGKLGGTQLQQATKATLGFAAALGIDAETAARRVALAIEGNVAGLGRFGVSLQKGATDAQRFNQIIAVGSGLFATAETQADTFGGKLKQLGNNFNDLQEEIGRVLLPRLIDFVKRLNDAVLAVEKFAAANPKLFATIVQLVVAFGLFATVLGPILLALPGLVAAAGLLGTAFVPVAAGAVAVTAALAIIIPKFIESKAAAEQFFNELARGPRTFEELQKGGSAVDALIASLQAFDKVAGIPFITLKTAAESATSVFDGLKKQVDETSELFGVKIPQGLSVAEQKFVQTASAFQQMQLGMSLGATQFIDELKAKYGAAFGTGGTLGNFIQNFSLTAARAISDGLGKALTGIILGTQTAREAFREFGTQLIATIVQFVVQYGVNLLVAQGFMLLFGSVVRKVADGLAEAWFQPALLSAIATLGGSVAIGAAAVGTAVTGGLAGVKAIQKAATGGGGATPFAEGGIVNKPTLALIGEAGPEAVIPLDREPSLVRGVVIESFQVSLTVNGPKLDRAEAREIADIVGELFEERLKQVSA